MTEMKQAGVIAVIGFVEQFPQPGVSIIAVAEAAQTAVFLNAPVFRDAQENNPVDGSLDSCIKIDNA